MARYNVVIVGTVDSDDPTISYLDAAGSPFKSAEEVTKYVEAMMSDELAIELTEVRVEKKL